MINMIFSQDKYPEQLYKTCDGLFSLQKKAPSQAFKKALDMAIEQECYSYQFIKNIITNKTYQYLESEESPIKLPEHNNTRGKDYYNNKR